MCGIDLSAEMVKRATGLSPDISFSRGDMVALDAVEHSYAAIVCFYAIIHLAREHVAGALSEIKRVLTGGGCCFRFTQAKARFGAKSGTSKGIHIRHPLSLTRCADICSQQALKLSVS